MITSVKLRAPKQIVNWRYANCRFLASGWQTGSNPDRDMRIGTDKSPSVYRWSEVADAGPA
jgi:hypothetical protein